MSYRCLLYYITDRKAFAPDEPTRRRCLLEKIAEAARAGVDYIQLREKDLSTRELESLASEAVQALHEARNLTPSPRPPALLINSRTDIALAVGADGVHLRSEDILPQDVKSIWKRSPAEGIRLLETARLGGPAAQSAAAAPALTSRFGTQRPVIGVSCHSPTEIEKAEENGATFAIFGPVFEKKDIPGTKPAGLSQLREACQSRIPVLALGGVTLENAQSCLEAGAAGIAAIRLFQENDVLDIVHQLRHKP